MVGDIAGVPIPVRQPWRIEAADTFAILLADQEQIRKIEGVRLSVRIKKSTYGRVYVDINFVEADPSLVIGFDAFGHRKLRRKLDRSTLSPANALEDEHRKIAFYFLHATAVPVPQLALFIEKSDCAPLSFIVGQFGALDRLSRLENALKVRVSKSAEDAAQLEKKPPAVPRFLRRLYFPLALRANGDCGEQTGY